MRCNSFLILLFGLLFSFNLAAQPEPAPEASKDPYTVSEVLNLIKGEWRQQYKIIEGTIIYDRKYQHTPAGKMLSIDTSAIHAFSVDGKGRTKYILNWEQEDGTMKFEDMDNNGSWDLKQDKTGVDLIIRNAYFAGCPDLERRIMRINNKQLLILDKTNGDHYYFTRR